MLKINSSFTLKGNLQFFLIINFVLTLGFFNSSWIGLLAWMLLFMCIYSEKYLLIRNWILIIVITIFSLSVKNFIKTPYILEGSNVFIGGILKIVFLKKIPPIIFKSLNEDFVKSFPKNIFSPCSIFI